MSVCIVCEVCEVWVGVVHACVWNVCVGGGGGCLLHLIWPECKVVATIMGIQLCGTVFKVCVQY